jgi:putative ABC transport system permease protein
MGFFAVAALALAALGLYGVLAYAVNQRTREFGVRMALGADRSRLLRMVIREGAAMAIVGVGLGIAGSIAAARFLAKLLAGADAADTRTLAVVSAVLIAVAIAASYFPARRATRVDPMMALRHE